MDEASVRIKNIKICAVINEHTPEICRSRDGVITDKNELPHKTGELEHPCFCVDEIIGHFIDSDGKVKPMRMPPDMFKHPGRYIKG